MSLTTVHVVNIYSKILITGYHTDGAVYILYGDYCLFKFCI